MNSIQLKLQFLRLLLSIAMVFPIILNAQYSLTSQQQYMINEWRDAYGGQIYYAYNYPKANAIYERLKSYSGMDYPIVFGQTFNWGQAHNGGLIILDYSSINKNSNILAFVFAHEWGHQALGHQSNIYNPYGSAWRFRTSSTELEDEADLYSGAFLGTYGYDIDIVCNYLNNLPDTDDHTHSTGRQRAGLVREGYDSVRGGDSAPQTINVPCTHTSHPGGDFIYCTHAAHYSGDIVPCVHYCNSPYGVIPCHPDGDIAACIHPMHPNGDVVDCTHPLHSYDTIRE